MRPCHVQNTVCNGRPGRPLTTRPLQPSIFVPHYVIYHGNHQHSRQSPPALPSSSRRRSRARSSLQCSAALSLPTTNPWGVWAAITTASAAGLWAEKTRIGKELSGPLVSTLLGLAMSNAGLIPADFPPVYGVINSYLLPLAVPLLLFTADLRRVVRDTGRLLGAFLVGSVATIVGTLAAWKLFPLHAMGADGWKVASALAARHIGGAVNYVGVCETLDVTASAQMAGLAADNLICAVYFTSIFALARGIPSDDNSSVQGDAVIPESESLPRATIGVLQGCTALALSACICFAGNVLAKQMGIGTIPIVTAITVALATCAPGLVAPLAGAGEGLAAILLQIFFAGVGANGSVAAVIATAPSLFAFSLLQLVLHVAFVLGVGRVLGFTRRELLLASNANVGGPTTAAGLAAAKGWRSSLVPALLVGVFGYAIATFVAVALGVKVLKTW